MTGNLVIRELVGESVIANDGSKVAVEALCSKTKKIALYFAARWCAECRYFTPQLIAYYNNANNKPKQEIEIIYVSTDYDKARSKEYFATMPWFAVEFNELYAREAVAKKLKVVQPPALFVFDSKTGGLVDENGVESVLQELALLRRRSTIAIPIDHDFKT